MSKFRWGMGLAVAALFFGVAIAEDGLKSELADIRAKLAAQESAKMAPAACDSAPEGIMSLNKRGLVKIGGNVNTRYFSRHGKIETGDSRYGDYIDILGNYNFGGPVHPIADAVVGAPGFAGNPMNAGGLGIYNGTIYQSHQNDLRVSDAKLYFDVSVSECFGAFLQVDLQSSKGDNGGWNSAENAAEKYYIYWKNIAGSGFGLNVGRKELAIGLASQPGVLGSYIGGGAGDAFGETWTYGSHTTVGALDGVIPAHAGWDIGRKTQINPYWEGMNGKLRIDLSMYQNTYDRYIRNVDRPYTAPYYDYTTASFQLANLNAPIDVRSRDNTANFTGRVKFSPIEDLNLALSVNNNNIANGDEAFEKSSQTGLGLGFDWRPAFAKKLKLWTEWWYGWNPGFINGFSSAYNFGASFDINEQFTVFAQGDYLLRRKDFSGNYFDFDRFRAWAAYAGVQYKMCDGLLLEAGWKHEWLDWQNNSAKYASGNADTIYGHIGFTF